MTRSHWGWGEAGKIPGREACETLANLVHGVLGVTPSAYREPVSESAIGVPLARQLPGGGVADLLDTSTATRVRHTYGRAYPDIVRGFYGQFETAPDAVIFPKNNADVVRILEWADRHTVAVVPFGGGTSVVGGVEIRDPQVRGGFAGIVALSTTNLAGVQEVDPVSRVARIGAGTFGPALEAGLAPHGLTLRHFPQSFEYSTLGGWIATRSGGHFATGRTRIDAFVEAFDLVTPSGTISTRRLPSTGAGPSPEALLGGLEGGVGVITEAWMRVLEKPKFRAQQSVHFSDFHKGAAAVRELAQSSLSPSNCRLLDAREAALNQVTWGGENVLILSFEDDRFDVEGRLAQAVELAKDLGGIPQPRQAASSGEKWRSAFFDGPYLQSGLVQIGIAADTFESAVTWDRFESFHRGVISGLRGVLKRVCGGGLVTCRLTHAYPDGVAPYFTWIAPTAYGDELERWEIIKSEALRLVVELGGTSTHHHAVGRTHVRGFRAEQEAVWHRSLGAVKRELDPNNVMNPGVLGL